ncbi:MAG: DUF5752 family protein [Desulfopila sp.]|jgi:CheY-like chemotaxis protein|nr:DUF5752 family protein [Desulfopila sp.]
MPNIKEQRANAEKFRFKSFHELMTRRIAEILLISSTYDAYIMQEDGPLAERIIHEYRGLNLSRPPRLTWISNGSEALHAIEQGHYDLVIVMPHIGDMDSFVLCTRIKEKKPGLPIYYFAYDAGHILEGSAHQDRTIIDRTLLWSGNTDLLLAIVKNQEDKMNVDLDTRLAEIRVIIFVEDSPFYLSSLLPVLYRELVLQTQAVMDDSLNEKDRLLRMRTRPKILVAENYEEAWDLYCRYKKYLFCVISDVRFDKEGKEDSQAGLTLLQNIHAEQKDLPLLILSSEVANKEKAEQIPALFSDKNAANLHSDLDSFFKHSLGFGDFIFRLENGEIAARAKNLRAMANVLKTVPSESLQYHARRNDFSRWLMARFEMEIAQQVRAVMIEDFSSLEHAREYLISIIKNKLKKRQQGLVSDFVQNEFDPDNDFTKVGKGSLGGKARGLAFISSLLRDETETTRQFDSVAISLPKTMVITTEGFDRFAQLNTIYTSFTAMEDDREIEKAFLKTAFPEELRQDLRVFLEHSNYPLAVRSSAILEDAHYRASAGAYNTYMLPNNSPDITVRLEHLIMAIKLIYSSIFQETPRILARNSVYRQEEDKMAVIIQQLIGTQHGNYYYPAVSGVAQSYNFYPVSCMKPAEGVAHIALGLGRIVVDDGVSLRFSPKYPQLLPQFSSVGDILRNAQRFFYALNMVNDPINPLQMMVQKLEVDEAVTHYPVKKLASTYIPADEKIRDFCSGDGYPVITFANILKYNEFPLGQLLSELLHIGEKGMGCPVEIEFAVNLVEREKPRFYLLQIRPMAVAQSRIDVKISSKERDIAWCYSDKAMGQSQETMVHSIVYVKPARFDTAKTREIAQEIEKMNSRLKGLGKRYVLIGPGRWGTADRWLGIPVKWNGITEAHTIIETTSDKLHADPSQGSHFFHNITSLGINYLGIPPKGESAISLKRLEAEKAVYETEYLRYIEMEKADVLKIDGKTSQAVILPGEKNIDG